MGSNEPESQRHTVCRSRRQHSGQGSCQRLARKDLWSQVGSRADEVLSPAGQRLQLPMPRRSVWCGAALCVWNSAVSAVVWSLPQLYLESGVLHPSGVFDKCFGIPAAKWGICPGSYLWVAPLYRLGCSDHVCRYLKCVSYADMPVLTEVIFLLNQSVMAD